MTEIKVDPKALHGVARSVAGSVPDIEGTGKLLRDVGTSVHNALGRSQHTAGASVFPQRAQQLAAAASRMLDCYGTAFGIYAEATATLANNATAAADTFQNQDDQNSHSFTPGSHSRTTPGGGR